uniref:Arf-GAP domain-containing protein n=1 Tax=Glossina morsitans morsitans TaxID=37546 RepID=A0A1B0FB98_GLOMM
MANKIQGPPTKQEIEAIFNRLRTQPANKCCFDCGAKTPTWSSVTYGVFICIDCSAVHRSLGVHLTFVRSTNLDTNWTWLQLRQMQMGGNANAAQFFRQHNCSTTDAQQKYNSRAAQLYRDKLAVQAQQAMKIHGTKLHLDNPGDRTENNDNNDKEDDFFGDCHPIDNNTDFVNDNNNVNSNKLEIPLPTLASEKPKIEPCLGAPSVELLNATITPNTLTPSIGVRKIQPKKSGLGARRAGGMGATKVKTNFAEIEQRANMANQIKDGISLITPEKPMTTEEELESVASMRLAYQDLSLQKNREEAKLKTIDPLKAKQMERLGMGFNLKGADISHSVLSDMETIQQAPAPKTTSGSSSSMSKLAAFDSESFFNDYSPTMYGGSGGSGGGTVSSFGGNNNKTDKQELETMGFEAIEPIGSTHTNITSMFGGGDCGDKKPKGTTSVANTNKSTKTTTSYESYTRKANNTPIKRSDVNDDNLAQRKFGTSKGFGSDQFFGHETTQEDVGANLSRFQGSNSISSADYFGESTTTGRSSRGYNTGVNFQAPDLDDVKESVRQGVHKVAGRLSALANDVMSKYGY